MIAIIQTGGKQYQVAEGEKLRIEKIEGEAGAKVTFSEVLLVGDEATVQVGAPLVAGATVEATIFRQGKAKKVTGIKHHAKKRYKMKFGHRQLFTEVEIVKIAA
jgi:large subunit ribosomal protein L21